MDRALQIAEDKRKPEPAARTWPPLEPVKRYQIRCLRESLLDRLKILAILMHKDVQEVANAVIEAGLQAVESAAKEERSKT